MDGLQELLQNDILWAGILSWFTAQVVKTILYAVLNKTLDFTRLVGAKFRKSHKLQCIRNTASGKPQNAANDVKVFFA